MRLSKSCRQAKTKTTLTRYWTALNMCMARLFINRAFMRLGDFGNRKLVNGCAGEFASVNVVVEQQVNLAKGEPLCLWQTEIAPDIAKQVGARVEQTSFGAPIPG